MPLGEGDGGASAPGDADATGGTDAWGAIRTGDGGGVFTVAILNAAPAGAVGLL